MNILIIGGTGNISSEVADVLYEQGHSITVVTTGKHPVPGKYNHIKVDRQNQIEFKNALSDSIADIVIDFFAFVPEHCRTDFEIFKGKIKQFIFISSATVYQKPHKTLPISEKTVLDNRFWKYAQDKIECERFLKSVNSSFFPVTIIRPSHTFGKTWIPSPVNGSDFTIANRILNGKPVIIHDKGESLWTLTASSDFSSGLVGLVGKKDAIGESFHITSDESLTWNSIYNIIGYALGKKPLIVHIPSDFIARVYPESYGMLMGDKKEHGVFDNSKIKKFVPGFKCNKTFSIAIRESIKWFMEDKQRRVIDIEQDRLIDSIINQWLNYNN